MLLLLPSMVCRHCAVFKSLLIPSWVWLGMLQPTHGVLHMRDNSASQHCTLCEMHSSVACHLARVQRSHGVAGHPPVLPGLPVLWVPTTAARPAHPSEPVKDLSSLQVICCAHGWSAPAITLLSYTPVREAWHVVPGGADEVAC